MYRSEIDSSARTVRRDDEEVPLTYSEFEILHKLASSPRRVFTREELMNHLWDGNFYGDLRSVDVHVLHLRQKIEDDQHLREIRHQLTAELEAFENEGYREFLPCQSQKQ